MLRTILADGPHPVDDVLSLKLGQPGQSDQTWVWALPAHATQKSPEGGQTPEPALAPFGAFGHLRPS